MKLNGRVLIIAGSDSGGGAGIQADIKTVTALGGYAATAITALTAQNTQGVFGIHDVPDAFIAEQMDLVLSDIGADTIKTGMLHTPEIIETVAYILESYASIPLIIDPVMVAKGGASLLEDKAITTLVEKLLPKATLITPNIPEAEILSQMKISNVDDMQKAGAAICDLGAASVLIKGGHLTGKTVYDVLYNPDEAHILEHSRIESSHTHGTGCTLSSAIATCLAQKHSLRDATIKARDFVYQAIATAPHFGNGHGPLNHCCLMQENANG